MHEGLPEAGRFNDAARIRGSCPYAGINRIRFDGSIRMDVSGRWGHPEESTGSVTGFSERRAGHSGRVVQPFG